MGAIAIKRVYDPPAADDGFRVLVDRLWPRGMTKEAASLDLWAKDLAPSPDLRREFNHQPDRFAEFRHHYLGELAKNPAVTAFRAELKRPKVSLLYGAHDRANNHAVVLAEFLRNATHAKGAAPAKKLVPKKSAPKKPVRKKPVGKKTTAKKPSKKRKLQTSPRKRSR